MPRLPILFLLLLAAPLRAADWPTYAHDPARSAVTEEKLALPLRPLWVHRPRLVPSPAWGEPARADLYNKAYNLRNRLEYDRVFHVAVAGGLVLFGSSSEDSVSALDERSGAVAWKFLAEGPVRCAPSVSEGRVYFGADDGFAHCLSLAEGKLLWRERASPRERRIPSNGRLISFWPVRTGVTVVGGVAYCAAGIFPAEGVHLAALDAASGAVRWRSEFNDLPAQGYLLASASRLYVTTGRGAPIVFDRADGRRLQTIQDAGGTYALLTGDTLQVSGGRETREVRLFGATGGAETNGEPDHLATFPCNHLIVSGDMSYLHGDDRILALDRRSYLEQSLKKREQSRARDELQKRLKKEGAKLPASEREKIRAELARLAGEIDRSAAGLKECYRWDVPCSLRDGVILAGETLFVGGEGEVAAHAARDGKILWKGSVTGRAFGLAVSAGRLYASCDDGSIHCFAAAEASR